MPVLSQGIPNAHTITDIAAVDIAVVGTTFNVFGYDKICAKNRTHRLPNAERMRYLLRHRYELAASFHNMCKKSCIQANARDSSQSVPLVKTV